MRPASFKKRAFLVLLATAVVAAPAGCSGAGVLSFDADDAGGDGHAADGEDDSENRDASGPFSIGGSIAGLVGAVVLQDNGSDNLTQTTNGAFVFPTPLAAFATYDVTVLAHPPGHLCTVTNGAGVVSGGNVTSVVVDCAGNGFTVGGSISGLTGNLVLRDNGRDSLMRNVNGAFTFAQPLPSGSTYDVTILSQPVGQSCAVSLGSGTISGSDVTSVAITCAP